MKRLLLSDIRSPVEYERERDAVRQRIVEHKRNRRALLGDCVALVFEDRETIRFQVEEMVRAEHLDDPAKIQAELDVYNGLLPDEGELSATLFVEITEAGAIRRTLQRLVGLDEHLWLDVEGDSVRADFEPGRSEEERISSVQYVRFRLSPEMQRKLATPGSAVTLRCDLTGYRHATGFSEEMRASLARDLAK